MSPIYLQPGVLVLASSGQGKFNKPPLRLSVVVPCYNEEENLPELERRVCAVCDQVAPKDYELILVNDGSQDSTSRLIAAMATRNPAIVGLELARNYGQQLALTAGLAFARGERTFIIDADLQDPPEALPKMMSLMDKRGANVIYGQRIDRKGENLFKLLTAKWFYRVLNFMTDVKIPLDTGDFRLMDRDALDIFLAMGERDRFARGMIAWAGLQQEEFPYEREARFAGKSKYSLRQMTLFGVDAITGFSVAPLRLAFVFALAFMFIAVVLALYVLSGWWAGQTVRGWTSVLLFFLAFSSVQLFCISIIGEYVGRTYMQSKNRPLCVVREVRGGPLRQHSAPARANRRSRKGKKSA